MMQAVAQAPQSEREIFDLDVGGEEKAVKNVSEE